MPPSGGPRNEYLAGGEGQSLPLFAGETVSETRELMVLGRVPTMLLYR